MKRRQSDGSPSSAACPYAASMGDNDGKDIAELAKTKCPAFQESNNTCPFAGAKSSEEVKKKLVKMPVTHWDKSGVFYKTLHHLHNLQPNLHNDDNDFVIPGGCPVYQKSGAEAMKISFDMAMASYSLSAIMAKMAQELENEEEGSQSSTASDFSQPENSSVETPMIAHPDTGNDNDVISAVEENKNTDQKRSSRRLSDALKTGTAISHQQAEDVHFVRNFIRGKIDRKLYASLVGSLFHVYMALEEALDKHASDAFPTCHFPKELNRTQSLREDLDFWHGTSVPPITPATQDYINRIQECAANNPLLLLAHAYTRYLGDLSGGKILARVAKRALSLDQEGLAFYKFDHVKSAKLFKDQYRCALNDLELTDEQIFAVVTEANVAFGLNMRLFEELDVRANIPGSIVRPIEDILKLAHTKPESSKNQEEKCPFAGMAESNSKNQTIIHSATTTTNTVKKGRCPWPFIILHDPVASLKDWQTWLVFGLLLCWLWNAISAA